MSDTNNVTLEGRLIRDPEMFQTQGGSQSAKFSLANNKKYKDKDYVCYIDCIAWGKTGEILLKYAKKGTSLTVTGELTQNRWQDKEGNNRSKHEILVKDFSFHGDGKKQDSQVTNKSSQDNPFSDDDVPF